MENNSEHQPHSPRLGWLKYGGTPCDLAKLPRCTAKAKSTGQRCGQPAMRNGKCHWHGGKSTGAPRGNKNALKHGFYTAEQARLKKQVSLILAASREALEKL